MGVVAVEVAREDAIGDIEPRPGRESSGRGGELGADRHVRLTRGQPDQSLRDARGNRRLVAEQADAPGPDIGVGMLE